MKLENNVPRWSPNPTCDAADRRTSGSSNKQNQVETKKKFDGPRSRLTPVDFANHDLAVAVFPPSRSKQDRTSLPGSHPTNRSISFTFGTPTLLKDRYGCACQSIPIHKYQDELLITSDEPQLRWCFDVAFPHASMLKNDCVANIAWTKEPANGRLLPLACASF